MQELAPVRNFFGKDPLQWWIGQVTDPKKGDWKATYETHRTETGEEIYTLRCRVRIIGYHDCEDDLPDKDLPLAHVLLPPNKSTIAQGELLNYQGGEVVVGFFLDGEDGQQPVVFGTLFKQPYQKDATNTRLKGATCFEPFTPQEIKQNLGKHQFNKERVKEKNYGPRADTTEKERTVASQQGSANQDNQVTIPSPCEDTEISKIQTALKDFIEKINSYQQILDVYVNPIMGKIVNIDEDIKTTASEIFGVITNLIRRARSYLIKEILDKLAKLLGTTTPKPLEPYTGKAVQNLTDLIFCLFEKIIKQLFDYLLKSLGNMVGKILDVPQCVVENFMGDMLGQLFNVIDNTIGPILSQINNVLGGIIGSVQGIISQALKYANLLLSILGCDNLKCPSQSTWSARYGPGSEDVDNFNSILRKASLSSLVSPGLDAVNGMIASQSGLGEPDCNANVLLCGPPRVDFVGGGGDLASGRAVINALGEIIGVAIDNSGFGFESPPLITFYDNCKNGYGAGGYAVIGPVSETTPGVYVPNANGNDVGVVDIIINNPGGGFLPNVTQTDASGNVKETVIDPNSGFNSDGTTSYVTVINNVVVGDTGFGYSDDTTVTVIGDDGEPDTSGSQVNVTVVDGFVVKAEVVNGGAGFTRLPELQLNSDTGAGARLLPVLKFIPIEQAKELAAISQASVLTVIDCVQR